MGLNREELRESAREWVRENLRTGKDAEQFARALHGMVRSIAQAGDAQLHRGVEAIMGRELSREQAFIWMEEIAGYLLALSEIIQERQGNGKENGAAGAARSEKGVKLHRLHRGGGSNGTGTGIHCNERRAHPDF